MEANPIPTELVACWPLAELPRSGQNWPLGCKQRNCFTVSDLRSAVGARTHAVHANILTTVASTAKLLRISFPGKTLRHRP